MIQTIAQRYAEMRSEPLLGGDSELLNAAITQAKAYVDGPMLDKWRAS